MQVEVQVVQLQLLQLPSIKYCRLIQRHDRHMRKNFDEPVAYRLIPALAGTISILLRRRYCYMP